MPRFFWAVHTADNHHQQAYSFLKKHVETHRFGVPILLWFEFQATCSKQKRNFRSIYLPSPKIYELDKQLMRMASKAEVFHLFLTLKGADLVDATIALLEHIPLAMCDGDFDKNRTKIELVKV